MSTNSTPPAVVKENKNNNLEQKNTTTVNRFPYKASIAMAHVNHNGQWEVFFCGTTTADIKEALFDSSLSLWRE